MNRMVPFGRTNDRQRNDESGTTTGIGLELIEQRKLFEQLSERDRLGEEVDRETGPIRRLIKSLTIKLEPFAKSLTEQEAISVRNAIESLLQDYFFEVQPWAVKPEDSSDKEQLESNSESGNGSGSVTYVGLAQILENKQTEDHNGVEVTMNGVVYFAEGSWNIPDENELLQTMEEQALGDSEAVVEALKDLFPTQQAQQLVVTIETPAGAASDADADATDATDGNADGGSATEVSEEIEATTTTPPYLRDDLPNHVSNSQTQTHQAVGATESNQQPQSPVNAAAVGGGAAFAAVVLLAAMGLFLMQRRRKKAGAYRSDRVRNDSGHGSGSNNAHEYLVGIGSKDTSDSNPENGFALSSSQDDWKANSNTHNDSMVVGKNNGAREPVASQLAVVLPTQEIQPTRSSPTAPESVSSPASARLSYLSSIFQRKNSIIKEHLEGLSSVSSNEVANPKLGGGLAYGPGVLNMSNYEFTDDSASDFDSIVSVQPHMVTLQSLESFEEQHTSMTRQEYVVQKDQLVSPFDERTTSSTAAPSLAAAEAAAATAAPRMTGASATSSNGDLYYSSLSVSSREPPSQLLQQNYLGAADILQELEDDKEDQRIQYSMMPNPYVRKSVKKDRSANCVLKSTDFTAASLAAGQNNTIEARSLHSPSNGMGMVPKISAPSWWSSSLQEGGNGNNGRSSAAAKEAYEEDDLAYSGDEENTFGVPSSDGWDPADTELSSLGDALTQEEINIVDFHSGQKKDPPPASEPASGGGSPTRRSPSRKIEVAKSLLQKMGIENKGNSNNSSRSNNNNLHKLGESIFSISSDGVYEEINFESELMEI